MSEIKEFVMNAPMFETHEHLADLKKFDIDREENLEDRGFRDFLSYANNDLNCALGTDYAFFDNDVDNKKFFELWEYVKTTGYGQAVDLGIQKMFGLSLGKETAEDIDGKVKDFIKNKSAESVYKEIYAKANVIGAITDRNEDSYKDLEAFSGRNYPNFIKISLRFDKFIFIDSMETVEELEKDFNTPIKSLEKLTDIINNHVDKANKTGNMFAFKIGVAYQRDIGFDDVSFETANNIFEDLMKNKKIDLKPLQDYIAHYVIQLAEKHNKPVQIHTGHLAGSRHDVMRSDPALLIPLFQKYKNVRFDLFHASWPYSEFAASLGKSFPNVWLDMCWAWSMNPIQMERTLDEWLSCVPSNKIFGFGGDTWSPFSMIGYAEQARKGIANVMDKKVSSGEYDLSTAKFVAERIMYKNAQDFFGL